MKKFTLILVLFISFTLVGCSFTKKTSDDVVDTDSTAIQGSTNDIDDIENNDDATINDGGTGSIQKEVSTTTPAEIKGKYSFDDENCNKYVKLMECLIDKTPEAAKNQTADSFKKVMELWSGLEKTVLPSTCKNTIDMLTNQKDVFEKVGCTIK